MHVSKCGWDASHMGVGDDTVASEGGSAASQCGLAASEGGLAANTQHESNQAAMLCSFTCSTPCCSWLLPPASALHAVACVCTCGRGVLKGWVRGHEAGEPRKAR